MQLLGHFRTGTCVCACQDPQSYSRCLQKTKRSPRFVAAVTHGRRQDARRKRASVCRNGAESSPGSRDDTDPVDPKQAGLPSSKQPVNQNNQPEDSDTASSAAAEPQNVDWREFRARLIANDRGQQAGASTSASQGQWAHQITKPEKGCLLLAHPLMFGNSQGYFSQAVIFLFEHDDTASAGFILNKPTEHKLGKLVGADQLCPDFADNLLYLGGDVGHDTMHFLHGYSDIQGASEVVQGVFMGGFEEARFGIRTGSKQSDRFRWFNRYAGWGPGQLEAECQAGVWFTAAASSSVILNLDQNLSGREMWHAILEMMGGDYALLSKSVKDAYPEVPNDS